MIVHHGYRGGRRCVLWLGGFDHPNPEWAMDTMSCLLCRRIYVYEQQDNGALVFMEERLLPVYSTLATRYSPLREAHEVYEQIAPSGL